MAPLNDDSPALDPSGITQLQQVIGSLLYYPPPPRAMDTTMCIALGILAAAQSKGTEEIVKALAHLLDFTATHPNAIIRYCASSMVLYIHYQNALPTSMLAVTSCAATRLPI
jgi:hypothetical protein